MFEIFRNRKGFVVMDNNELVLKYNYGNKGGHWTATGYFDEHTHHVIKNNGEILEHLLEFGTMNATHYIPVITDAYILDGKLFVKIIRKTRRWVHTYRWRIERM